MAHEVMEYNVDGRDVSVMETLIKELEAAEGLKHGEEPYFMADGSIQGTARGMNIEWHIDTIRKAAMKNPDAGITATFNYFTQGEETMVKANKHLQQLMGSSEEARKKFETLDDEGRIVLNIWATLDSKDRRIALEVMNQRDRQG